MRRILLVLTFMSFAAWSQPAQQQAQAPIAVKVETPPPPPKTLPNYLQQFGPLLAACVAVGVAFMQRYLQKQQLKQNLFEKRWDVYRDLGSHINTIVHQTSQNSPDWSKLLDPIDQMEHAQFLFGKEVALHERYSNCNARSKKRSELLKVVRQCLGRRWRRLHLDEI